MSASREEADAGLGRLPTADITANERAPTESGLQLPAPDAESKHRICVAVVLAALLLAGGVLGSELAATSVAHRNSQTSQDSEKQ